METRLLFRFGLALSLLCLGATLFSARAAKVRGPYRIEARVDRTNLAIDEECDLVLRVFGAFERFIPPALPDFGIIATSKTRGQILKSDRLVQWREFAYRLRPKTLGNLTIGSARIEAGAKVVARSPELQVTVTNVLGPIPSAQAARVDDRLGQDVFLHGTTHKDTYWVGENMVFSWDIIYRDGAFVRPLSVDRAPRLRQASRVESLPRKTHPHSVRFGKTDRMRRHVSRMAAVVEQPGEFLVDAMRLFVRVEDRFEKARLVSPAYSVSVRSLPKGQPDAFESQQVGTFRMKSRVVGPTGEIPAFLQAGDLLFVGVTIEGEGNIHGIQAPKIQGADAFEVRQIRPLGQDSFEKLGDTLSGRRLFRFSLQARRVGRIALPKVVFAYFDPDKGSYKTLVERHGTVRVRSVMNTLYGGQVLGERGRSGVRLELGWPGLSATYVMSVTDRLELSPRVQLRWGRHLSGGLLGIEPGFELRWRLVERGPWSLALYADPGLFLWIPTDGSQGHLGFRLGFPGLLASYQASPTFSLILGLRMPLAILDEVETLYLIPLVADLGGELRVYDADEFTVNATGRISAGPEFCIGPCKGLKPILRVVFGAAVIW